MDVEIDATVFAKRVEKLFGIWEKPTADTDVLKEVTALAVMMGEPNDEAATYTKTASLQTYLLGYEFPSTLMLFTLSPRKVTFVCSSSKAKILKQIENSGTFEVEIKVKGKDEASAQILPELVLSLGEANVGTLPKDKPTGKLPDEWNQAISASKAGIKETDVAGAMAEYLAEKDGEEMKTVMTSCNLTSTAMLHYFKSKMESMIDRGTKMSHEDFAALIEEKIGTDDKGPDMKLWGKNSALGGVDFNAAEWVYTPIIQSGGEYDLKVSAQPNDKNLKPGVILSSLGVRYKSYCASMGRTFLISPSKKQESNYAILLEARTEALKIIKDGVATRDIYNHIQTFVSGKSETLGASLVKNLGFATGIEFRDATFVIGPKNTRSLKENMTIVLSIGFADLTDSKKNQKYSLLLSDTVKVGKEGSTVLTDGCTKLKDVVMELDEEEPEPERKPSKKPTSAGDVRSNGKAKSPVKSRKEPPTGGRVLPGKTRGGKREQVEQTTGEKIKANQQRLHQQRQQDGLAKWESGDGGKANGADKAVKRYESYRREEQLPREIEQRRVCVDEQRQTVILPIYGSAVPFHISTIKNVTKVEENDRIVLRINFQSPGQIAGKKEDMPFEDPDATFVRSASFRSEDTRHMIKVFESITALKKAATKREAEKKELADVVEQEKLIEMKGRHPYVLKGVYPRPATEGKKADGNLEIHQNGIRFRPDGPSAKIDVLFSNIKHLFFQPSEKELIVLIHINLRSPIMLGKKKTYDVQFYREVTDMSFDETGGKKRRARYGDEDEIEQEQEDRKRRAELDKHFSDFARRIESAAQAQQHEIEVDMPFRELGFSGVPHRSNVLLLPTTNCLVHLSEFPFTVITLGEIEVVHLERVQFGLKNFDMVFVFSDFKKAPVSVNTIPVVHLDNVKEWLDSCDVPISEGPVNLTWGAIMKTINDDPYEFYNGGGWDFLTGGGDDSDQESSEEGSVFEDETDFGSEESSESDESGSDFDEASDDSGSFGDESDEGEDWDELERKAERADKKVRETAPDSDDDRKSKKKGGRR